MTPTVVPVHPFNPRGDAENLWKANKNEQVIINILAERSNIQRTDIAFEFRMLYGGDLREHLKKQLSGDLEKLAAALMTRLPTYYAKELHDAIHKPGTDEDVLIEILCTLSNQEIRLVRVAYHTMYDEKLESDLKGDTSGLFRDLMVSLCAANRDESTVVNPQEAKADAEALLNAEELCPGTDDSIFTTILCQRNYAQLLRIFQEYKNITGHNFEDAIKSTFFGDAKNGFVAVISCIKNKAAFFAKQLNKSMKGLGTNDRQLIRLVVTRCEVDMQEIKREYKINYGKSLAAAIKDDTSKGYKNCLLALIGEG